LKRLAILTGECRRLAETDGVPSAARDGEFGPCRDLIRRVEEDEIVDLARPEVRSSTARRRHVHRLHPVGMRRVATVHVMRRTAIDVEYLYATAAAPASEVEAVVRSPPPTNMAAAKIAADDINKMTSKWRTRSCSLGKIC